MNNLMNIKPPVLFGLTVVIILVVIIIIYKYMDNKMNVKLQKQKKKLKKYYEQQFNQMFYNNENQKENKLEQQPQYDENIVVDGYDSSSGSSDSDQADISDNKPILQDDYKKYGNEKMPRDLAIR